MLLDLKSETPNSTKPRGPDQIAGPPGEGFGETSPFKNNLLAVMAVLGATYGWVLAFLTGVTALIVILFR